MGLFFSCIIGGLIGWFVIPGILVRIKSERGIKGAPKKDEGESSS